MQLAAVEQTNIQYDPEQITPSGFRGVLANIRDKNILPFYGCELLYSDDIWDFSPYKKTNVPDTKMKVKFKLMGNVKEFILLILLIYIKFIILFFIKIF